MIFKFFKDSLYDKIIIKLIFFFTSRIKESFENFFNAPGHVQAWILLFLILTFTPTFQYKSPNIYYDFLIISFISYFSSKMPYVLSQQIRTKNEILSWQKDINNTYIDSSTHCSTHCSTQINSILERFEETPNTIVSTFCVIFSVYFLLFSQNSIPLYLSFFVVDLKIIFVIIITLLLIIRTIAYATKSIEPPKERSASEEMDSRVNSQQNDNDREVEFIYDK